MATYRTSRRIGRGGMAEVFLAMQEGIGGFEKLVVLKRIYSQFSEDPHFVNMFLQEAKLAASIHHPNVVQIQDIDKDAEGHYLVMEYLHGETLSWVYESLKTRGEKVPPTIASRVGASVAAGLHHAHTATDAAGNPQPIVHRDVTPSNILVSYNGIVKILDFGVAKATLTEGSTRAGALKGKMSYLAPEQIHDLPIDGRADVFQLGICLHEMLTGRRLFKGKTDHQKITAVLEREIVPPSTLSPRVPRVLDEVVLKALSRDPNDRQQTADELRRDLENVLREIGTTVSAHDVGDWMMSNFPERRTERLRIERECVEEIRSKSSGTVSVSMGGESAPNLIGSGVDAGDGSAPRTPTMATYYQQPHPSHTGSSTSLGNRGLWLTAAVLMFVGLVSMIAYLVGQGGGGDKVDKAAAAPTPQVTEMAPTGPVAPAEPDVPKTYSVVVVAVPKAAKIEIDGKQVAKGELDAVFDVDGKQHKLVVSAKGYKTEMHTFKDEPPPRTIRLQRDPSVADKDEGKTGKAGSRRKGGKGRSSRKTKGKGDSNKAETKTATSKPDKGKADKSDEGSHRSPKTDNIDPWDK